MILIKSRYPYFLCKRIVQIFKELIVINIYCEHINETPISYSFKISKLILFCTYVNCRMNRQI